MGEFQDTRMRIACSKIWQAYKEQCETSYITRNGTIVSGVLESYTMDNPYARAEFVAEHQFRSAYLLGLILMSFPDISPKNMWFFEIMHMLGHDVGELKCGDTLDDGSAEHERSRAVEAAALDRHYQYYPDGYRETFGRIHRDFESMGGLTEAFDKMTDKTEAILFLIFLLSKGLVGDVRLKEPPSERDLKYAEILEMYRPVDVWCLHFRNSTKDMPQKLVAPLMGVIRQAFLDVLGLVPKCCSIDVNSISI